MLTHYISRKIINRLYFLQTTSVRVQHEPKKNDIATIQHNKSSIAPLEPIKSPFPFSYLYYHIKKDTAR